MPSAGSTERARHPRARQGLPAEADNCRTSGGRSATWMVSLLHSAGALHQVGQLPHIARPRIALAQRHRFVVNLRRGATHAARVLLDEVLAPGAGCPRGARGAAAASRDHVEPVVEVLAEVALARSSARGRGSWRRRRARPPLMGSLPPTRLELPLLEHAQELRLQARAASRRSRPGTACRRPPARTPDPLPVAPVNAPFSWPNSSLSSSVSGMAAQLMATNGLVARRCAG